MIIAVERRAGPSAQSDNNSSRIKTPGTRVRTTLGATPRAREGGLVDVELGLAETAAGDGAAGVGHLLEDGLGRSEVVDQTAEGGVGAGGELVDKGLEDEGRVAGPGVEVVGTRVARTGNDDTGL